MRIGWICRVKKTPVEINEDIVFPDFDWTEDSKGLGNWLGKLCSRRVLVPTDCEG